MDLTVCVCTHDRPGWVKDCLEGLGRQTVGPDGFGVVLVDSGSSGDNPARLRQLATAQPGTRLIRLDRPGLSAARNAGAQAAATPYIAYLDDDAIPAPDWVERILAAIAGDQPPAMLGGRILPRWLAPLPPWWPARLLGVLSLIDAEGVGDIEAPNLARGLALYGANMVLHVPTLLAFGGFDGDAGRRGSRLLSDEETRLARRLRRSGHRVRYDSSIVVSHQIPADRLRPEWLLRRLYWQGASAVLTDRALDEPGAVWRELPRRLAVAALCAPAALLPKSSSRLIGCRWRHAYAAGFIHAALNRL